jgi:hypothetical protein
MILQNNGMYNKPQQMVQFTLIQVIEPGYGFESYSSYCETGSNTTVVKLYNACTAPSSLSIPSSINDIYI